MNQDVEKAILEYLWRRGPGTVKQVSRNLIFSPGKVARILEGLLASHKVERIRDGDIEKFKAKKAP